MKKVSYLKLYEKWMEAGCLPGNGLCKSFRIEGLNDEIIDEVFFPVGSKNADWWYLGDGKSDGQKFHEKFTPLRQTALLFLAAINNEL